MAIRHFPSTWCKSVCAFVCVFVSVCQCVCVSVCHCVCVRRVDQCVSVCGGCGWCLWHHFVSDVVDHMSWYTLWCADQKELMIHWWTWKVWHVMTALDNLHVYRHAVLPWLVTVFFPTLAWLSFPWDVLSSLHAYVRVSEVESESVDRHECEPDVLNRISWILVSLFQLIPLYVFKTPHFRATYHHVSKLSSSFTCPQKNPP